MKKLLSYVTINEIEEAIEEEKAIKEAINDNRINIDEINLRYEKFKMHNDCLSFELEIKDKDNYTLNAYKWIALAQLASDIGKYNDTEILESILNKIVPKYTYIASLGYSIKEEFIVLALTAASHAKNGIKYWVQKAPDQNGNDSIITYFETPYGQVSFHSFEYDFNGNATLGGVILWLGQRAKNRSYIKWDKITNGSRETAIKLATLL